MKKVKKNKPQKLCEDTEMCVVCGKKTEYLRGTPIDKRVHYVEGVGQLGPRCYYEVCLPLD